MTLARRAIKTRRRGPPTVPGYPRPKPIENSLRKQHRRLISHALLIAIVVGLVFFGTHEAYEHRLLIGSAIAEILNLMLLILTGSAGQE